MDETKAFTMEIAGLAGRVSPLFASTRDYCRKYLVDRAPEFSVNVTPEDLRFEQEELDAEAREEGFRLRVFTDPFLERQAIQRAFAEHLLPYDTLLIHGSAVAVDGKGYLFIAKSGTGKSTHVRHWLSLFGSRAVAINDDKPFLRITKDTLLLCGAPWSGKHGLDSNLSVPLQGICLLERGDENCIRPLTAEEALPMLRHQSYTPLTQDGRQRAQHLTQALAQRAALWQLSCTKEAISAQISFAAMSSE